MRVIGGRSRGRRLPAKVPPTVRPTSDRVREAIFDMLDSMGGVESAAVGDLFCGSGAMGVEALSRGAASVTFVDRSRSALDAVRSNLHAVGLGDRSALLVRASLPQGLADWGPFDLAICDPPYRFGRWEELLGSLRSTLVVAESSAPIAFDSGWEVRKARRYGGTLVTVARSIRGAGGTPADR